MTTPTPTCVYQYQFTCSYMYLGGDCYMILKLNTAAQRDSVQATRDGTFELLPTVLRIQIRPVT